VTTTSSNPTRPIPRARPEFPTDEPIDPNGPKSVKIDGVSVTFSPDIAALCNVSFQIPAGQQVSIVGPSGSGKSTLVNVIAQRQEPTDGTASHDGRIAVIHQDLRLVKQRTALQNVLHGSLGRIATWRTFFGFPKEEKQRAIELLERVGLAGRVNHRVSKLSGGERQRVAIARALMQHPRILLADEPVASLDNANACSVMRLLRDLGREANLTVITVLHDHTLACDHTDRVLRLEDGRLVYDGDPKHLGDPKMPQLRIMTPEVENATPPPPPKQLLTPRQQTVAFCLGAIALAFAYMWSAKELDMDPSHLRDAGGQMTRTIGQFIPHKPEHFEQISLINWGSVAYSLLQTIYMSLWGTTLGVLFSWPMAALAARNAGPRWMQPPMRLLLNVIRSVPSLFWALLFVAAVGLGPFAGVLALVAYSIGYLTKFFYEAFEEVDPAAPDALAHIGASKPQQFFHAIWPAAAPAILSSSLFMFEYNVRAASVLGIVGAGGIGVHLMNFFEFRMFGAATICLLMILAVVVVLDVVSSWVRSKLVVA